MHSLSKSQSKQSCGSHCLLKKLSWVSHALGGSLGELKDSKVNPASKRQFDARQSKVTASPVELSGPMILSSPLQTAGSSRAGLCLSLNTLHPSPTSSPRHLHWAQCSSSGLYQASPPHSGPRYLSSSAASHRHTLSVLWEMSWWGIPLGPPRSRWQLTYLKAHLFPGVWVGSLAGGCVLFWEGFLWGWGWE